MSFFEHVAAVAKPDNDRQTLYPSCYKNTSQLPEELYIFIDRKRISVNTLKTKEIYNYVIIKKTGIF